MSPRKTQPKRVCQFCGEPGSSKAHIVAQRLHPVLGNFPTSTQVHLSAEFSAPSGAYLTKPPVQTHKHNRPLLHGAARGVCRKCNSEWMNRVEASAYGPLTTLIQAATAGLYVPLGSADAVAVATWATMTAWNLEIANAERRAGQKVTPASSRLQLSKTEAPPQNATVAIGQRGYDNVFNTQNQVGYTVGGHDHHALVTVFSLRKLLIYVATFDHTGGLRPHPPAACWRVIWPDPSPTTTFPPPHEVKGGDLEQAMKDFRGWLQVPNVPFVPDVVEDPGV